jgi:hypothetical protein
VKNLRAIRRMTLSRAGALGAVVAYARDGVLVCIVPGRTMPTAACTSTSAVAVSSAVVASATLVTSTAAVPATAMVASPVPSGVSSVAGFCNGEGAGRMGQDGVADIETEDHWTAHGNH